MTFNIKRMSGPDAWAACGEHFAHLDAIGLDSMHRSMLNSEQVYLGCDDDVVFALWGLIPPTLLSDRAYLWLWTTAHFTDHVFMFIRHSQRVTAELLERYPILVGHGRAGDTRSLRWLQWCGAQFGTPQGKLIPFEIRAKQWPQQLGHSA